MFPACCPAMTLEDTGLTEDAVMNVRDRSLEEAYADHDIGTTFLFRRLRSHGFTPVAFGDDKRHADAVLYGDGPDVRVCDGEIAPEEATEAELDAQTVAFIEIKTKTSQEWFGRCNRRHFTEYVNFARERETPVFIWFALIDADAEQLRRDAFFRVRDTDQAVGDVVDVTQRAVVFDSDDIYEIDDGYVAVAADDVVGVRPRDTVVEEIPNVHGNDVVCLDEDELRSFPHFLRVVS